MSIKLQHTLIRASAGSGKTYQLANRFIALLLLQATAGKAAPERLVAVTFTRKGAGEFAERILQRLAKAAQGGTEFDKLRADLNRLVQGDEKRRIPGLAPGLDFTMDVVLLQRVLAAVVDDLDRLALGTIDSFMARSVQTLAFDLGLDTFDILEEGAAEQLQEELLGEVFFAASQKNLESLFQLLKQATLKSVSGSRRELSGLVDNYHELFHSLPEGIAWGGKPFWMRQPPVPPNDDWRLRAQKLQAQVGQFEWSNKLVRNGLASSLEWLARREPGMPAGNDGVPSWLDVKRVKGEEEPGRLLALWPNWPQRWSCYPRSDSKKPCIVPAAIMVPLKSILERWLAAECAAYARKTGAIYDIVRQYEVLYARNARRKGRLSFADLPLLLKEGNDSETAQRLITTLAFRWFQQYDHWMLDEFQDTSRVQWSVLQPWLDEALQDDSGCKSVFVVGDPKQSIYGWRGGEPRLFDELNHAYPGLFQEQVMSQSWRSRPSVLELVNRVCDPEKNPALKDPRTFSALALPRWRYDHHVPEASQANESGYSAALITAEAQHVEDNESEDSDVAAEPPADKLAPQARVIKSVLGRLKPIECGLTCAILVRKNENAQAIAQWLRANEVPNVMVEGDSTLADQSPVVAALVDALRWLDTPAHTLAGGHVQLTPLWNVLTRPFQPLTTPRDLAGTAWEYWRRRMSQLGAGEVTREWCAQLGEFVRDDYGRYCLRQVDQLACRLAATLALPDWRLALEQLTVRETAAAGSIHVMTIHKAKGLGFDVVFLPDLDLGGAFPDSMLLRRDTQGQPMGCLLSPPKYLRAWIPELESLQTVRDSDLDLEVLCVLYVALTRAKEATFVIMQKGKPRKPSRAREWLLGGIGRVAVGDNAQPIPSPWGEGELLWQHGACDLSSSNSTKAEEIPAATPHLKLTPPVPRRERRKPSDTGHRLWQEQAGTSATWTATSGGGQEFGTAVHEVFEQIEWWTPGQALGGDPEAVETVRKCMEVPEIRALFTLDTSKDEACRELPVELMEENTWWSGIVDRLVLRRDSAGALARAVLVDFKTDTVDNAETLCARYSEQLAIYRRAIALALNLPETRVRAVLLSTHLLCLMEL